MANISYGFTLKINPYLSFFFIPSCFIHTFLLICYLEMTTVCQLWSLMILPHLQASKVITVMATNDPSSSQGNFADLLPFIHASIFTKKDTLGSFSVPTHCEIIYFCLVFCRLLTVFITVISFDPYKNAIGKTCRYTYFTLEQTEFQKSWDFFRSGATGKWDKLRIQLVFSFQISYFFSWFHSAFLVWFKELTSHTG